MSILRGAFNEPWYPVGKYTGYCILVIIYIPVIWLVITSFTVSPLSGLPLPFSFQHYQALFRDSSWQRPFLFSIILALINAICGTCLALFLSKAVLKSPLRRFWMLFTILPLFIPGMAFGSGLFTIIRQVFGFGLGYWSIALAQFIWGFPFAFLVMLVVLSRFDTSLLEASSDLGGSSIQTFVYIELPLLLPGLVGSFLFAFLLSFNELQRSIFVRGLATTMPLRNWIMATAQQSQIPVLFALSALIVMVTLPTAGYLFLRLFSDSTR